MTETATSPKDISVKPSIASVSLNFSRTENTEDPSPPFSTTWREKPSDSFSSFEDDSATNIDQTPEKINTNDFQINENHFAKTDLEIIATGNRQALNERSNILRNSIKGTQDQARREELIESLVRIQMKLASMDEADDFELVDAKLVSGHKFIIRKESTSSDCETCCQSIWTLLNSYYHCKICDCCVHEACLNKVNRSCAGIAFASGTKVELRICPEKGLAKQKFKCAGCQTKLSFFGNDGCMPRLCDYSGFYFCRLCHWNNTTYIPARIIHNWDIREYPVSRYFYHYLNLLRKKPIFYLKDLNEDLKGLVGELDQIIKLREDLMDMKFYVITCKDALDSKILLKLSARQHFVDDSDVYSLEDFIDVANDALLEFLIDVHSALAQHIKTDCARCRRKGEICCICREPEVLFPFDNLATQCKICCAHMHKYCFARRKECAKCNGST